MVIKLVYNFGRLFIVNLWSEQIMNITDNTIVTANTVTITKNTGNKYAWALFFARYTDRQFFRFILAFLINLFTHSKIHFLNPIDFVITLFIWLFVEAALLASWGTTPGKWLFGIKVRDQKGNLLLFNKALQRSFLVWLKGMALGLPIIKLITNVIAYGKLMKLGKTTWDESCQTNILHQKLGLLRITLIGFLVLIFLLILVIGVIALISIITNPSLLR